jgi:hypothetical protein
LIDKISATIILQNFLEQKQRWFYQSEHTETQF